MTGRLKLSPASDHTATGQSTQRQTGRRPPGSPPEDVNDPDTKKQGRDYHGETGAGCSVLSEYSATQRHQSPFTGVREHYCICEKRCTKLLRLQRELLNTESDTSLLLSEDYKCLQIK